MKKSISLLLTLIFLLQMIGALSFGANTVTVSSSVPKAVKEGAAAVVNKAKSHEGNRILRFMISSDAHQKNDHQLITSGTKELGQAQGEIARRIDLDFAANLGDVAWGSKTDTVAEVQEQIKTFKRLTSRQLAGVTQLWCEGNHDDAYNSLATYPDTPKLDALEIYDLIYRENDGVVYDPEHAVDGYCYKDFSKQKVRVICLNTEQGAGEGGVVEGYQLKWFAETALDMSGKRDWNVVTLAHHPFGYGMPSLFKDCINIVDAFINGDNFNYTTTNGTAISVDYADRNCQYVAHFHGHTHAFCINRMQKYISANKNEDIDAWEICIPNACYTRNNQNLGNTNPRIAKYSTEITYNKENVDGKRTSFNLVTISLDEKKIYLDNYGVGIDREVDYSFHTQEHTEGELIVDIKPTCAKEGKGHTECTVCGKTMRKNIVIEKTDHNSGKWVTTRKPTSSQEGHKELKCTKCGTVLDSRAIEKMKTDTLTVFADLKKSDWYVKNGAIDFAYNQGLFSGISETEFGAKNNMTRGMFVTVLGRLHGVNSAKKVTKFTDVKQSAYYSGYIAWASKFGIVSGTSATTFGPDDNISREQICAIMVRYCDFAGIKLKKINKAISFSDAKSISSYARKAVTACQRGDIVNGEKIENGYRFRPKGNATRAEVATIIMKFYNTYIQ